MDSPQEAGSSPPNEPKQTQEQIKRLQGVIQALQSETTDLRKSLSALNDRFSESSERYIVSCPGCSTRYDMLAHHYSIGLFDNMVYVKCPNCNKSLPIQGGSGGQVKAVIDKKT